MRIQYLDDDSYEDWVRIRRCYPFLTVGCFRRDGLIALVYGKPSPRDAQTVVLDGIAVIHTLKRQGIGSSLLSLFHKQAKANGFQDVTLGSAGGYVNLFYLKNGYRFSGFSFSVPNDYKIPIYLGEKYSVKVGPPRDNGLRCFDIEIDSLDSTGEQSLASLSSGEPVAIDQLWRDAEATDAAFKSVDGPVAAGTLRFQMNDAGRGDNDGFLDVVVLTAR